MIHLNTYNYIKSSILKCGWVLSVVILFHTSNYAQSYDDEVLLEMTKNITNQEKLDYLGNAINTNLYSNPIKISTYAKVFDSIAQLVGTQEYKAKSLTFYGIAHYISEDYDVAINYYLEAIRILETKEWSKYLSQVYNNLAGCYKIRDDFKNTEKYFLKSREIAIEIKDLSLIASLNNNLAVLYMENKYYNKADIMFNEAIAYYKRLNDSLMLGITYMNQGNSRISSENYAKAMINYNAAIHYVSQKKIPLLHAVSNTGIGTALTKQGKYSKALPYLNRGIKISKEVSHIEQLMESYSALSNYYAQTKNFKSAYELSIKSQVLKDSILTKEQDNNMAEAITKYETEKKEREIVEHKLTIEKKERQKNKILLGLIALGILVISLFIFFKKRIKYQKTIALQSKAIQNQKITELQQKNKLVALNSMIEGQEVERLRIAKDLHDSLGGLLSTVKTHFTSMQKKCDGLSEIPLAKKTNRLVDEACMEVRRISHNMIPHALSISGLQGVLEDLGEQLNEEGYQTTVEVSSSLKKIDETKKVMFYRLVQEIISNIRKHAQAKTILIQLLSHKNEVNIIIEDDGIGFDHKKAITNGGLGLKSIHSRVEFLDGKIDWDSQIGKGTTVIINIPI